MYAKVESDHEQLILGVGGVRPDEPVYLSEDQVQWFRRFRGIPLIQENMPEGATVTIFTGTKEE